MYTLGGLVVLAFSFGVVDTLEACVLEMVGVPSASVMVFIPIKTNWLVLILVSWPLRRVWTCRWSCSTMWHLRLTIAHCGKPKLSDKNDHHKSPICLHDSLLTLQLLSFDIPGDQQPAWVFGGRWLPCMLQSTGSNQLYLTLWGVPWVTWYACHQCWGQLNLGNSAVTLPSPQRIPPPLTS